MERLLYGADAPAKARTESGERERERDKFGLPFDYSTEKRLVLNAMFLLLSIQVTACCLHLMQRPVTSVINYILKIDHIRCFL
jgi:hypothetical protein